MCQKCVNRSRDIYAPKMRTSLMQHTCKSAKTILTKVQDIDVAMIMQTIRKKHGQTGNFPYCPETFHNVIKICRLSGNFPDRQENFQTVLSNHLETFKTDCLETFQTIWKLSRLSITFQTTWKVPILSENFPPCLETFSTVRKVFRVSGNFPDRLENFQIFLKLSS